MRTGGQLIVDCLEAQGVERVFCVPGESYLPVLDALRDSPVETVVARQEGGAAMMAEADGKMTGRPGVALVTRGPGAANAASGVHVAKQDSTPMVLLVGQIGRAMRGREAFQEVDYRQTFRDLAKWVEEIDHADRIPEVMSHAWHVAMAGRPGPVVLALPEDMLREAAAVAAGPRVEVAQPAPRPADIERLGALLRAAERPFVVVGGSRWTPEATAALKRFALAWDLPVGASFRRQHLMDHREAPYAGDVGLGCNPALKARIAEADLLILLGARFSENPSQDFSLLSIPKPAQTVVHVHPGPEELGRIYAPDLSINATPAAFLEAAALIDPPASAPRRIGEAHAAYRAWSAIPETPPPPFVRMGEVIRHLDAELSEDAILCNGAGNYAIWLHRFMKFRGWGTQLAPTSGSMGYGLPAAVAAKLRHPTRPVVCLAGDGCFQMTMQEFGTACQAGAAVVVLVCDNGMYGTIRMHQEKRFPGRVAATGLANPDFAALARAYGAHAETVATDAAFPDAFAKALAAGRPALLHLLTDPEQITPAATLDSLRAGP
ncbi:MAG: thiamine pyrophosphate-binding protein [Rhodobacteraceae bacterium]|nr:MAG: thiamine pyrophosphate-binding protein [Paracoccaceae bacterium]